ncbi:MAG TPA: M42 family peptidase [Thermotogaceae bacterium]|nr:M42 family metallopeptidase [Thermotogota bacterium]HEW92109.1 M42 family peptidase [Thermotogaceae bacterium]
MKDIIKILTEISAPSGREDSIAEKILEVLDGNFDGYRRDKLGNLIVWKEGKSEKKILFDAHMDEIGVVVTNVDENGFLRIEAVGGVNPYTLVGSRINFSGITGVVGIEGESLKSAKENLKNLGFDVLFVDVGAKNKEEATNKVKIGSFGTYDAKFQDLGDRLVSKAMDDRIGCAVMIQLLKEMKEPLNSIYCVFAVQEELGLVGATVAGYDIEPDVAIAIDVTAHGDTPKAMKRIPMKLGNGPALKIMDGYSISDRKILEFLENLAEKEGIPYQLEILPFGGTDAGAYQRLKAGVPSATVSIVTRYVHSPNEMVDYKDVLNTVELLKIFANSEISF